MATTDIQDLDYLQLASDSGKQLVSTLRDIQNRSLDVAGTLADQASNLFNQAPLADPAKAVNVAVDLSIDLLELQRDLLLRLTEVLPTIDFGVSGGAPTQKKMVSAA